MSEMKKNYKTTIVGLLVVVIASVGLYFDKIGGAEYVAILTLAVGSLLAKDA